MTDAVSVLEALRPIRPAAAAAERLYGIPSGGNLRWIVPARRSAALRVLNTWRPYGRGSRIAWLLLRAGLGLLGAELMPLVRLGPAPHGAAPGFEAWRQGRNLVPVVYVGTPGPQRKAVCYLVDDSNAIAAIAKLPLAPAAATSIAREARVLEELRRGSVGDKVPALMLHDRDLALTLQTAMPGVPGDIIFGPAHEVFLLGLRRGGRASPAQLAETLATRVAGLTPEAKPDAGDIEALLRDAARFDVPEVWQHGDFAPWNTRARAGELHVFDWEDARADGVPGMDAAHFFVQQAYLFGRSGDPLEAMNGNPSYRRYLAALGLSPADGRLTYRMYCLSHGLNRLAAGDTRHATYLFEHLRAARLS